MRKKISIAAGIISVISLGLGFYLWRQFTKVPDWYSAEATPVTQQIDVINLPQLQQSRQEVYTKINRQIQQNPSSPEVTVTLTDTEINDVLIASAVESLAGSEILQATRGINTTIAEDQIELGMVVNTANLDLEAAETSLPIPATQILSQFPLLKDRDIYIGLSSQPQIIDGQLQLTGDTRIRVGNFSLTLAEIANHAGMSEAEILQEANQVLKQWKIREMQLQDGQVMIKRDRF